MRRYLRYFFLTLFMGAMVTLHAQTPSIREQHKVKKSETLFGISKQYNVTIEQLKAVNPEMNIEGYELKKGDYINIPYTNTPNNAVQSSNTQQPATQTLAMNKVRVGVMLPLHDINGDGKRMVEYYRGLLLACDRLKKDGISVDVQAWNVPIEADVRMTLLEKGADKCDIIFGPLYTNMVKPLAEFCQKHNIKMVIPFSISGEDVKNYASIYQVYQSPSSLNASAVNSFIERFKGCQPVFINCNDATESSRGAFTANLRKALEDKRIKYRLTDINSSDEDFAKAFSKKKPNIVVLNTSRSPELNTVFAKLNKMVSEGSKAEISMFGYIEWLMYTQVYEKLFYQYNAYIPTTFYYNPLSADTKWVETNYRNWFRTDMMQVLPRFALTGFDHGCFFIGGISKYGKNFGGTKGETTYKPVQTPLAFKAEGAGKQNKAFMLIHYLKNQTIEAISY